MVSALLLSVALVAQTPQVRAAVDRTEVVVGGTVTLTIRVEAAGGETVELAGQPRFTAFRILGSNQSSAFNIQNGVGIRTTTWEFRLRAETPGRTTVGPIRLRVGISELQTAPLAVDIDAGEAEAAPALGPRLSSIVDRAPGPDGSDEVIVSVVSSPASIVLGDQLDLVVVAWFPRDVRSRLRTRPTLTPPELRGAWSYSQTSALGVALTREVDGRLYDLFVHHQVVFPLTAGRFEVGPASVSYNLPLRMSILSREVPQEVQSQPVDVLVEPQPIVDRPVNFGGVAAADLSLRVSVDTGGFSHGDAGTVTATLEGRGNVALWPEPEFTWPAGVRVYPGQTDVFIDSDSPVVGGRKIFRYLLVPDAVGSYAIPEPRFVFYDLDRNRLREISGDPARLVARVDREETAPPEALAVVGARGPTRIDALTSRMAAVAWVAVLAVPPLLALLVRGVPRLVRRRRAKKTAPELAGLPHLDTSFRTALERMVPDGIVREGDGLAAALEAAGVEAPVAAHAARVRDRLRQAVYGPTGATDADELAAEVHEVLRALPGASGRRAEIFGTALALAWCVTLGGGAGLEAQGPSAEQLFEAGGYGQAADSFALRAATASQEPAHWINLGHARYAADQVPEARVAWITAARLRPRDQAVRAAMNRPPALDAASNRLVWVSPATPTEALVVGAVLWVLGWTLVVLGARFRRAVPVLGIAVAVGAFGGYVEWRYGQDVGLTVRATATMRAAPYGTAPARRVLGDDIAVRVLRRDGAWLLVERDDVRGWMLDEEVARI